MAIKDLTLKEVIEQAEVMKAANKDSQGTKNTGVHKAVESWMVMLAMQPQQQHPCYRCGKASHPPTKCRFMGATCQNCGKVGQIVAVCQSGKRQNRQKNIEQPDSLQIQGLIMLRQTRLAIPQMNSIFLP